MTPEIVAVGRCGKCSPGPPLVNVNLGPGNHVMVYAHRRIGALAAEKGGSGGRHRAIPALKSSTMRYYCAGCGSTVTVKRSRLVTMARAAAVTAVNGRCEFLL